MSQFHKAESVTCQVNLLSFTTKNGSGLRTYSWFRFSGLAKDQLKLQKSYTLVNNDASEEQGLNTILDVGIYLIVLSQEVFNLFSVSVFSVFSIFQNNF